MSGGGGTLKAERAKRGKASKRKKMKRVGFYLDMTPLVDITFLLLTFFMFTTTMATPQVMEMSIPPEQKAVKVPDNRLFSIMIDRDGKFYWFIGNNPAQPVELKDILPIAERENLRPEVRNLLITALKISDDAPYEKVVNILDELNLAEVRIIGEIGKDLDDKGQPARRDRMFTLVPMPEDSVKKKLEEPMP